MEIPLRAGNETILKLSKAWGFKVHGDFLSGNRRGWDIEFKNVALAAEFAATIRSAVHAIDIRANDSVVSLWNPVVLTIFPNEV